MGRKKRKIKIGFVGVGNRGLYMLLHVFCSMSDVEVVVVCDTNKERLEEARTSLAEINYPMPLITTDYQDILNHPDVEGVILMCGWPGRVQMAIAAMEAGKYAGIDVGCAYTLEECWDLVDTYEKTGVPVMMLENCCYGRAEMMSYNVAEQGLFGEVVHCDGAYRHYLVKNELFQRVNPETGEMGHYRLSEYKNRNCAMYPTHEMGPICKLLKINRGNRLLTISSFGSKNVGLRDYINRTYEPDSPLANIAFRQSDIVTSILTTEEAQTINICFDTTLPRAYYSRDYTVRGTRGMYTDHKNILFFDHMKENIMHYDNIWKMHFTYGHPLHLEIDEIEDNLGPHPHGMDWLVCRAFIEAIKNGTNTPIDAYDTATLLAVAPLSQMSIEQGSIPIPFPDFTRGRWQNREPIVEGKYCLDKVCIDKKTKIIP